MYLYHHPEEFYLIKMFGDVDGKLMCIPFKTSVEGKTSAHGPTVSPQGHVSTVSTSSDPGENVSYRKSTQPKRKPRE